MWTRESIKELVLLEIDKYAPKVDTVTENMRLTEDLKFLSDDFTYLALTLQRKTGAKPPLEAWREVGTVEDVIDLILTHAT